MMIWLVVVLAIAFLLWAIVLFRRVLELEGEKYKARTEINECYRIFKVAGDERTRAVELLKRAGLRSENPETNNYIGKVIQILRGEERFYERYKTRDTDQREGIRSAASGVFDSRGEGSEPST